MQLRYLQTLNNIATEQNSTIIFPLPVDLFTFFQKQQCNLMKATNPFCVSPPTTTTAIPTNSDDTSPTRLISTDI